MSMMPLFSIAIPTYNRLELLRRAVDSALKQSYENIEIVILNNASTDGTRVWIDKLALECPKVKIVHQSENLGCVGNIKTIPKHIGGKYLVVLSDDDWLEPAFAKEAVADMEHDPTCTVWYCRAKLLDSEGRLIRFTKKGVPSENGRQFVVNSLSSGRDVPWCSMVYVVKTLIGVGGFVGNTISLDFTSKCLCALEGNVLFNDELLSNYVLWNNNVTSSAGHAWVSAEKEIYILLSKKMGDAKFIFAKYLVEKDAFLIPKIGILSFFNYIIWCRRQCGFFVYFIVLKRIPLIILNRILPQRFRGVLRVLRGKFFVMLSQIDCCYKRILKRD